MPDVEISGAVTFFNHGNFRNPHFWGFNHLLPGVESTARLTIAYARAG